MQSSQSDKSSNEDQNLSSDSSSESSSLSQKARAKELSAQKQKQRRRRNHDIDQVIQQRSMPEPQESVVVKPKRKRGRPSKLEQELRSLQRIRDRIKQEEANIRQKRRASRKQAMTSVAAAVGDSKVKFDPKNTRMRRTSFHGDAKDLPEKP